ncbi:hypothetical protein ACIP5N_21810 [Streptomyces sp. NPDC088768]|uniref:hypothetical protein n=1 Tax=Streptomyces sp. NPDC088768 TaxID=3365894 RepID=UPI00381E68D5
MRFLDRLARKTPATPTPSHPEIPADVQLTTGAARTAARRSEHPLIGLGTEGNAVHLTPEDGHVLTVAPYGAGTTELLRTLGAQALAAGHHVDILDIHHVEHPWARDLEHVTYVDEPDQLHRHLLGLAHQARNRALGRRPGPRRLLLVESDGTHAALLGPQADPRPNGGALEALTAVLAHGRPAGIQVVLACKELPGPLRHLTRDLFSTRLLNAPSPRTWSSAGLAGLPLPDGPAPRPGLWHHITRDGTHRFVQAARISQHDATAFARRAACPTKEAHR